ncbi:MAG TPA: hypothetical protein VNN73_06905 [Blastocatellia bacterium]|nr:hypothetical protein [Blastocatellia bacterium]
MVTPPDTPHGYTGSFLTISLPAFLAAHGMPGKIYHPREAIYIDSTYFEPDIRRGRLGRVSRAGRLASFS